MLVFLWVKKALETLPDQWLFFLTSDATENVLIAGVAYVLFYYAFAFRSIWLKVAMISSLGLVLAGLAALKDYRIHQLISGRSTFDYFSSFLGIALLFYLLLYFISRIDEFNRFKKLERELAVAQEQLLRNQLHPHFLYNAFNSLYSLSLKNRPEVADYILKLSAMMRYITDDVSLEKVPLSKEIDFIQKYIAIEKLRFGTDASIDLVTEKDENKEVFIEPFLLIPLVENAFKHGFYTNAKDAYVHLKLNIKAGELVFEVTNSVAEKKHFQHSPRKGRGLDSLKQRLNLLYQKDFSLMIRPDSHCFRSKLTINLSK